MTYNSLTLTKFVKRFLVYGLIGLVIEVIYTGLASLLAGDWSMHGFTFLVMLPIYGLAVFLEPVHNRLSSWPWWSRGLVYLAMIWLAEYVTGIFLKLLLGVCPWNYTDFLNINGVITLHMAPQWFLFGLGLEKIQAFLDRLPLEI